MQYRAAFNQTIAGLICAAILAPSPGFAWITSTRTIVPGKGIHGCQVGMSVKRALARLGKPTSASDEYVQYARRGLEIQVISGRVESVSFYFTVRGYRRYRGRTSKGIGALSTYEDVVAKYGPPDRVETSEISEHGAAHRVEETYLPYGRLGLGISFFNGKLAIIRVMKPGLVVHCDAS